MIPCGSMLNNPPKSLLVLGENRWKSTIEDLDAGALDSTYCK